MGEDPNHRQFPEPLEILEELSQVLHGHDFYVGFAARNGCEEPDADEDPPCVDVPLGLLRRARSALTHSRASSERIRILENALQEIARTGESRRDSDELLEEALCHHIPHIARRALSYVDQASPEGADRETVQRVEELEWALREVLRYEDEGFQYSHELAHRVWIDIPDLARRAVASFAEEELTPFCEPHDPELPF